MWFFVQFSFSFIASDIISFIYICIYIVRQHFFVNANFSKHNRHFMSTYFLLDPFECPYYFYCILGELIYVLSIVVCIPSTFCPTLGHHQGRIYYKRDVTFVLALYLWAAGSWSLKYVYLGSISSLIQISLNIIDILCLHIFFWIRSNSRITFINCTSTTLSRRLTMHLSDTSSIAQH